jgi:hypothetical protein
MCRFFNFTLLSIVNFHQNGVQNVEFAALVCRNSEKTSTCVGRVVQFVKAVPWPDALGSLLALGLPVEPQKFAIVEAYIGSQAQQACMGVDLQTDWAQAAAGAQAKAGMLADKQSFIHMLLKAQESATVLRVGRQRQGKLSRRASEAGELHMLAIPVSSHYETWRKLGCDAGSKDRP